jgi:hypothetical protein
MENKEITNKLIAEFMGYKNISKPNEHPVYKIPEHVYDQPDFDCGAMERIDTFSIFFDDMKFHTSWAWLVPVVEKIETFNHAKDEFYGDYTFTVTYFIQNWTANFITRDNTQVVEADGPTRIEAVYRAVLEFIKWYNQQK